MREKENIKKLKTFEDETLGGRSKKKKRSEESLLFDDERKAQTTRTEDVRRTT